VNVAVFAHKRTACRKFEAKLEDYLDLPDRPQPGAGEDPLVAHLQQCARCHEALDAARLARSLLRGGREPAPEAPPGFAARVVSGIHAEEGRRIAAAQFWRPLELLASRLALAAAMVLLLLTVYVFEFAPARERAQATSQPEVGEGLPEPPRQPGNSDEVLLSLAERSYGR
jgi:hypothetical protein